MVVTGAFATHTTRLWNYYVCPRSWGAREVEVITVNYLSRLQYVGRVVRPLVEWNYDAGTEAIGPRTAMSGMSAAVQNDLHQFRSLLNSGDHLLFLLEPIYLAGCGPDLMYGGTGPFTQSHRYFDSLDEMLLAHRTGDQGPDHTYEQGTSAIDGEVIDP